MDRFNVLYVALALVFASNSAFANINGATAPGDLMTRDAVTRLVQQGRITEKQIIEVRPSDFVKLQRRAVQTPVQKTADLIFVPGGLMVLACTIALCVAVARDNVRAHISHRDGMFEVGPPEGGW